MRKRRDPNVVTLAPVRPSIGFGALYRARFEALIDEMARSVEHWVAVRYRQNPPELAQDASPAVELDRAMRALSRRWRKRFNDAAPDLARYHALGAAKRSDAALRKILERGGFAVKFKPTRAMNDALQATIAEQVGLIKSIPEKYLGSVQGSVMRAVQQGSNLAPLTKELREQHGVTKRRAAFIARDQNAKAVSTMARVRADELGLDEAEWVHSGGGRHPRPTHVANDGKRFSMKEGWPDPALKGKRIWPGTEPNCHCVARLIVPGLRRAA